LQVDQATLERCVQKLLGSAPFVKSSRQQALLNYLLEQTLAGHSDRLKGYSIGVEVFGRGSDFDPATDAVVRVEVARLRSKLQEYYAGEGAQDALRIDLPKGSYGLEFRAFPAAGKAPPPAKAPSFEEEGRPSLAVLPLSNLCAEPGQDYFVDGITDSLIYALARLSGLVVISRQSSFAYRGSEQSSSAIGNELRVGHLLEGSVQRSGTRVRITVQLIDTATGRQLWSERYEGDLKDIFALQDEVTRNIVKALQVRLAPAEAGFFGHEGTNSVEAHDALLRGLECHWKYSPVSIGEARQYFSRAVEHDPGYAAAHAWLARSMIHQWIMRWSEEAGLPEGAEEHASLALELRPDLPYVHAIRGWVHLWRKQREPALACCRRAVALDPNNPESLNMLSMCLSAAGYGTEALYYVEKALRLNPHSSPFFEFVLGQAYYVLEDYEKAIEAFGRGCELSSTFAPNHVYLCLCYGILDRQAKMQEKKAHVLSLRGGRQVGIEPPWLEERLAKTFEYLLLEAGLIAVPRL
jgi:adenylate cyclase